FVFSSRRRHTRSKRDWSSDVCSSDLYAKQDEALSGDFVMRSLVLLRVRDEDARADRLDPERRVAVRKLRVDKLSGMRDEGEGAVEDVDVRVVEVGGVEQVAGWRRREREPLVDRAEPRAIGEDDGLVPLRRMPAANLPGLGGEDEDRPRGGGPEDGAGRTA